MHYAFTVLTQSFHVFFIGTVDYKCTLDMELFEYAKNVYGHQFAYVLMLSRSMQSVQWQRIHSIIQKM